MKKYLYLFTTILSTLGVADTAYLSWMHYTHQIPTCQVGFKCELVLTSSWSEVGGVPLSILGVFFYFTLLMLSSLKFLNFNQLKLAHMNFDLQKVLFIVSTLGLLFSAYLVGVMGLVLKAWCQFCLLSAANCLILFSLNLIITLYSKKGTNEN